MPAILFGSISTLADTSELQRHAFNEAFRAHELSWEWSRADYQAMLGSNGGADRITEYARSQGQDVDAAAVHATKSEIFRSLLASESVTPRAGVVDTVSAAKSAGIPLGFVTTTSSENVAAILAALPDLTDAFDVVVDSSMVDQPKPDAAAYTYALRTLGTGAEGVVAIEDNAGGVRSASAASVRCIAFPNENTDGSDFDGAYETAHSLDAKHITDLATAR